MVTEFIRLEGKVFSPHMASALKGSMWCDQHGAFWLETVVAVAQRVEIKRVSGPIAGLDNQIWLLDGQRFVTSQPLPREFYADKAGWWKFLLWFEKFSLWKLVAIVAAFVLVIMAYQRTIPILADVAVTVMPKKWDVAVGEKSWQSIDGVLFTPTVLGADEQRVIGELFTPIAEIIDAQGYQPRLQLRGSPMLGANAVALPGGIIVITDDLWRLLEDKPRLLQAVMAHEAEHVLARHSMRQIVRYVGVAGLIFAFGLEDSLLEELSLVFSQGLMSSYSRQFETSADAGAARIMTQLGQNPESMIDALAVLGLEFCGEQGCPEHGWLDSHPDIDQRIQYLKEIIE